MADDIDIEEHDILENLPLIDNIKSEPIDYEDSLEDEDNFNFHDDDNETAEEMDYDYDKYDSEGSSEDSNASNHVFTYNNKIILGSKPDSKVYNAQVVLEDWGVRLNNSACFCKDCEILFATRNALDAHNMAAHSFLVAMDKPVPEEPKENNSEAENMKRKYCNHCQKYFEDDNLLIQHLYDFITAKMKSKENVKTSVDSARSSKTNSVGKSHASVSKLNSSTGKLIATTGKINTSAGKLNASMGRLNTSTGRVNATLSKMNAPDIDLNIVSCLVCHSVFKSMKYLKSHMSENHGSDLNKFNSGQFTGYCDMCDYQFNSLKYFNSHIRFKHPDKLNRRIDELPEGLVGDIIACPICPCQFVSAKRFKVHTKEFHGTVLDSYEMTTFTGLCSLCNGIFSSSMSLNKHLRVQHPDKVYFKIKGDSSFTINVMFCPLCSSGLRSIHKFNTHTMRMHGTIFKDVTMTEFNRTCNLCKKKCSTVKILNSHVIRMHQDKLNFKVGDGTKINKEITAAVDKKIMYKCPKCNVRYNDLESFNYHLNAFHDINSEINNEAVTNIIKDPANNTTHNDDALVPRNIILKCAKCPQHFLNIINALAHAGHNLHDSTRKVFKCHRCKRMFRLKDRLRHELQHKYTDRFHVYTLHDRFYARLHLRCPKCSVYFDERGFRNHILTRCGKKENVGKCNQCNITVNSIRKHMLKHIEQKLIKSDFIFVEDFVTFSNKYPLNSNVNRCAMSLKRKLSDSDNLRPVKGKILKVNRNVAVKQNYDDDEVNSGNHTIFYYCSTCSTYTHYESRIEFHKSKECANYKLKKYCFKCGLLFLAGTLNRHNTFHNSGSINPRNCSFVRISDLKPFVPAFTFNSCKGCGVSYVISQGAVHRCKKSVAVKCKICKQKFNTIAFRIHLIHHKYYLKPNGENLKTSKPETKSLVTSLKSIYKMIIPTWNILYKCNVCVVTTDSYDNVIEHCQNHFNNLESYGVIIKNCEICDMNFEISGYERHIELHSNESIKRDSFKIVEYDYYKLLNKDWLAIFDAVPQGEMEQILSRSIYSNRLIKMNLVVNGPPEYTIYRCETCIKHFLPHDVYKHAKDNDACNSSSNYICSQCGLNFNKASARAEHAEVHSTSDITANSYRVVSFNDPKDKEFNEKMISEYHNVNTRDKSKLKYKVYQCQNCFGCTHVYSATLKHECKAKDLRSCKKCGYLFHFRCIFQHKAKHSIRNFKSNMKIVPFNAVGKKESILRIFKCQCGLHFTSLDEKEKHIATCRPVNAGTPYSVKSSNTVADTEPKKYYCGACRCEINNRQELDVHLESCNARKQKKIERHTYKKSLAEGGSRPKNRNVTKNLNEYVFRCVTCNIHFLSIRTIQVHYENDHPTINTEPCTFCDKVFTIAVLSKHKDLHHKDMSVTKMQVIDYIENDKNNKSFEDTLFKCVTCDLCFCKFSGIWRHFEVNHQHIVALACAKCGHKFSTHSYKKHLKLHHPNNRIKRKHFNIIKFNLDEKFTVIHENSARNEKVDMENPRILDEVSVNYEETDKFELKVNAKSDIEMFAQLKEKRQHIIYRCALCNTYFMNPSTLYKHVLYHSTKVYPFAVCKICELPFSNSTLKTHENTHHVGEFDLCKVIVVAYSNINGRVMKSKARFVKDMVQSRLVSTTTDIGNDARIEAKDTEFADNLCDSVNPDDVAATSSTATDSLDPAKIISKENWCENTETTNIINDYEGTNINEDSTMLSDNECDSADIKNTTKLNNTKESTVNDNESTVPCKDNNKQIEVNIEKTLCDSNSANVKEQQSYKEINSKYLTPASKVDKELTNINDSNSHNRTDDSTTDIVENNDDVIIVRESLPSNSSATQTIADSSNKKDTLYETTVENVFSCNFCSEQFDSHSSREFHEILKHLDTKKSCPICDKLLNAFILKGLHLAVKNDLFTCCICSDSFSIDIISEHAKLHKSSS